MDYHRADYRRAITTSSRNRQSNFSVKRNIKLQSPKCLNFRLFISFFLQIFPAKQIKSSKVYFIFLISVFAVFTIDNLNVCHRNFDVNRNHCNCTTFKTEVLDFNKIRYNCDEMAEITYPHLD